MSKAIVSTVDTIGVFKGIAVAHNAGLSALDVIKGHIETLRKGNVKFGKSKSTCELRIQALDAYKAAYPGKSVKTLANYVTGLVAAVNEGKEFSLSGSKGAAAPKGAKGKGKGKAKGTVAFSDLFAKPFNHEAGKSFKDLCAKVQQAYLNDEFKTLYEGFADYLKAEGFILAE
jgi:hypothetical protein